MEIVVANNELKLPLPTKIDPKAGELTRRINYLIHEYDGEISLSAAVGALEIVKYYLLRDLAD
jgi:aspartate ammonia-lyase